MVTALHVPPGGPRWVLRRRRPESFVPGKLIVRFKSDAIPGAVPHAARAVRTFRAVLPEQVSAPLEMLKRNFGLRRIDPVLVAPQRMARMAGLPTVGRSVASLGVSMEHSPREKLRGYNVIELESEHVSRDVLKRIAASDAVEFVERVPNRWTSSAAAEPDPSLNLQWGLRAIEWFTTKKRPSAAKVHVAVLDTGVDAGHADLKSAVAAYDHGKHSSKDLPGHGTHVSGIIAAIANNGIGICGVANCRLHVWKVFSDPTGPRREEQFDDDAYHRALAEVLDSPARIVNLSLGGTEPSRIERDLIAALVAEGVLVVAAMGNEYDEGNPKEWPAAYPNVLAVGAIGETRRRAYFSNSGPHIGLMAPGNNILSTVPRYAGFDRPETNYASWAGTSMAAPHVVGCAALVKARYPGRDGTRIADRLRKTALKLPAMQGKTFTAAYGHGLVSAARALI